MYINTRIAAVSLIVEARTPTEKQPTPVARVLHLSLLPTDERDHLDLDTGELFQDAKYARVRNEKPNLITASMNVREAIDDSSYQYNRMQYFPESKGDDYGDPSSIHFDLFVASTAFAELVANIGRGLLPETISIQLFVEHQYFTVRDQQKPAVEYGWEADGSGKKWHNREHPAVKIEAASFKYAIKDAQFDESRSLLPARADNSDKREHTLHELLKYSKWSFAVVVFIAVMLAVSTRTFRLPW